MKKAEREHVEEIGERAFACALAKTTFSVRMDARLTGLDKIRVPLAQQAALVATGFPRSGFGLGKDVDLTADMIEILEEVMTRAIEAARPKETA